MKSTTRLYDILRTSWQNYQNDHKNYNQLISTSFFNDNLLERMLNKDTDLLAFIKATIFLGSKVPDDFIWTFLDRFLMRSIKFQTFDLFRLQLVSEIKVHEAIINAIYGVLKDSYLVGKEFTDGTGTSKDTTVGKALSSSLPQQSVDFDQVDYADSLDKNENTGNTYSQQHTETGSYSLKQVNDYSDLADNLFIELDKRLFSQIY